MRAATTGGDSHAVGASAGGVHDVHGGVEVSVGVGRGRKSSRLMRWAEVTAPRPSSRSLTTVCMARSSMMIAGGSGPPRPWARPRTSLRAGMKEYDLLMPGEPVTSKAAPSAFPDGGKVARCFNASASASATTSRVCSGLPEHHSPFAVASQLARQLQQLQVVPGVPR